MSTIGQPLPLRDGRARVTGALRYAADLAIPGLLHARLVTSPYAHAKLLGIDPEATLATAGVVAVLTAADMPAIVADSRHTLLLARDRVIFVGQPVALVIAESEAAAEDGLDALVVEYEPQPAVVEMEAALEAGAPLVWPKGVPKGSGDEAAAHGADVAGESEEDEPGNNVTNRVHWARGDVEAALAASDATVEREFRTAMVHQSYLEPHVTIAQPDPLTDGMMLWSSTQAPFYNQEQVAAAMDISESDVRVTATPVGGGFGGKFILYEPLVALAARHLGRPVRLALTRMEEMQSGNPAPAAHFRVRLGATKDGTLTALALHLRFDAGCYPGTPLGIAGMIAGSTYRVENLLVEGEEVLTFKPSQGAYRAPGAPQVTFALESAMDDLARALDLDPIEFRLQNAAHTGDKMVTGRPWNHMGLSKVLEALRDHPAWQQRDKARAEGRGIGMAVGGWPGGTEPAAASCHLQRDGTLRVDLGSVDLTGTDTTFAMLAADTFGVTPEQVSIAKGDTLSAPYAGATGGSKITYTVGPAVIAAAQEARAQALAIAAEMLEAAEADLEIKEGAVQVRGAPSKSVPLRDIAGQTMRFGGKFAPVVGNGRHANAVSSPGFCAQLAELSVDDATGEVTVHRLVLAQDVGRAINPLLLDGQLVGGAAQGIGWGLYEAIRYDEEGQLLTGSLMDYTLPKAVQIAPTIETILVENPTPLGPLGARGAGEPPVIATAAAIANAIADATGIRATELPIRAPHLVGRS